MDCGYSLEPPCRGGSNEYRQSMSQFWAEIWKISQFFFIWKFLIFGEEFSIYLNRRVFVMCLDSQGVKASSGGQRRLIGLRIHRQLGNFAGCTCQIVHSHVITQYITKIRLFKYIENLTSKNWKFSDKKKQQTLIYFIFMLNTWLWVLVRTASTRRF